jgi:hypothetical protein
VPQWLSAHCATEQNSPLLLRSRYTYLDALGAFPATRGKGVSVAVRGLTAVIGTLTVSRSAHREAVASGDEMLVGAAPVRPGIPYQYPCGLSGQVRVRSLD